jgi:hypothetical protein
MITRSGKKVLSKEDKLKDRKHYISLSSSSGILSTDYSADFDKLPFDVFHEIHSYLTHYDYRQFMNCNKSIFLPIKYETVYYDFKEVFEWKTEFTDFEYEEQRVAYCKELLQYNVKNKRKQVEMAIAFISKENFFLFSDLLNGISKLTVSFNESNTTSIPRLSFENIYSLVIQDISGLKSLNVFNLQNLVSFKIITAPNLIDVTYLSNLVDLKKVEIGCCNKLVDISCLEFLSELTIYDCDLISDISHFGKNQNFFYFVAADKDIVIPPVSQFQNVKEFMLGGAMISSNFSENEINRVTTNLGLKNLSLDEVIVPCIFRNLMSVNFSGLDLRSWTIEIPALRSVTLEFCLVHNLSAFNGAKWLVLSHIHIASEDFQDGQFPKLKSLKINGCHFFSNLICPKSLASLEVTDCLQIERIVNMTIVQDVEVTDCPELHTLQGLTSHMKSILIAKLPKLEDFSFLNNIPLVAICDCPHFADGNILQNAKEVYLKNCPLISNLSMLGNVTKLFVKNCVNVIKLTGLENVRKVSIIDCCLEDLDGLGNNQIVLIEGVSKDLLNEFRNGKYSYLKEQIPDIQVKVKPDFLFSFLDPAGLFSGLFLGMYE